MWLMLVAVNALAGTYDDHVREVNSLLPKIGVTSVYGKRLGEAWQALPLLACTGEGTARVCTGQWVELPESPEVCRGLATIATLTQVATWIDAKQPAEMAFTFTCAGTVVEGEASGAGLNFRQRQGDLVIYKTDKKLTWANPPNLGDATAYLDRVTGIVDRVEYAETRRRETTGAEQETWRSEVVRRADAAIVSLETVGPFAASDDLRLAAIAKVTALKDLAGEPPGAADARGLASKAWSASRLSFSTNHAAVLR